MLVKTAGHLRQFHFHNGAHRLLSQRAVNHRLKARHQCRLKMVSQQGGQQFMQVCVRGVRFFLQQLHDVVAAQIGGHQNHGVTEVDFPPFAVAHKAPVEHLIEQVHHVAMRLFHFVEQHHAVRAFAYRFGQHAALTVADIARRRTFQLGNGMRFLIFRKINGDKGFFTAKQSVGQCERSFGFTGAAGAGQQEYPLRAVLRREAGLSRPQPLCDGAERRALPDNAVFKTLFHTEQVALLVLEQG